MSALAWIPVDAILPFAIRLTLSVTVLLLTSARSSPC